jgi:ADP-ribosylglycohydrolase
VWRFTDDTNMALSIYAMLRRYGAIDQDALAAHFARYYARERGYGAGARHLLKAIRAGQGWRSAAQQLFGGGSYGNGGAMRSAPVGAYFAGAVPALLENARLAAEITHAHPEGIAGALAVALAAGAAVQLQGRPKPSRPDFIAGWLAQVPEGAVQAGCERARDLPPGLSVAQVVAALGNGRQVTAQDTVPLVVYMAAEYLDDYEEALWQVLSAGGDTDTTAAMVGGIVVSYTGAAAIPAGWLAHREPLPRWAFVDDEP